MELFYCDTCGLRIKSGDGQIGPAGDALRYCEPCYAKKFPDACISTAPVRTTTPSPGAFKSAAVINSPNDSSSRRKPSKQEPVRAPKSGPSTTLIVAGGAGAAAVLLLGFMVFGGKSEPAPVAMKEKAESRAPSPVSETATRSDKPTTVAPAFKREAAPSAPAPMAAERNRAPAAETPQRGPSGVAEAKTETGRAGGGLFAPDKLQAQSADEFRENYARRRLDELLAMEQKGSLKPADLRKRASDLATGYGNTAAGKEAAEKLKSLNEGSAVAGGGASATVEKQKTGAPNTAAVDNTTIHPAEQAKLLLGNAPDAPAATAATPLVDVPTRILWKNAFDAEDDWKVVSGTRETAQTRSGAGMAVRSEPVSPGYFTARIDLKFSNAPLKLGANSWIKFTYRTQGTADICFHIGIGNAMYEKFMFGIQPGKWKTTSFHFNQFGKCITRKNDSQPEPNSDLQGITMFLGGPNAAGASVVLDDVVIGDGPIPDE